MTAPALTTRFAPLSGSYNPETRTFTAVAATSSPVKRTDYFAGDSFLEVLSMDPKAIRLDRFASGRAPFLNSHRSGSLEDQIGVITGARIEAGQLLVDVQLSARDDVKAIAEDIAAGITVNVSIGYRVHSSEEQRAKDGTRTVTHTSWEPFEVSLVTIPADGNAHIRSFEVNPMTTQNQGAEALAERTRVSEINSLAQRHGISSEIVARHVEDGTDITAFRSVVLDTLAARSDATAINNRHNDTTFDNPGFLSRTIEDALYARMSGQTPEGAAREWASRSILDMGAAVLQQRGQRPSWMNRDQLASQIMARSGGQHSTSDFPILLTQAGARVLQGAYQNVQTPLKALARKRTAVDFRALTSVRLSEAPRLLEVGESGEVKHGSRSEVKESFALKTYSRLFSLSRAAILCDDLGGFADTNRAWGRAAAETEADVLVALLTANAGAGATMDDGKALYHTDHGNLVAVGTVIDTDSLSAARKMLRDMKGVDGVTPMSVTARHLLVGSNKETEAEKAVAQINASQIDKVNPFANKLQVHCEPRLTGNSWRLFADPSDIPVIEYAYLSGQEGPILDVRPGWEVLGAEFRCILDFGAGLVPAAAKATVKNPGA